MVGLDRFDVIFDAVGKIPSSVAGRSSRQAEPM